MRFEIYTWDSHALNDSTNYNAVIQPGNAMPSATATFIDLGRGNPILAGKVIDGGYFTFMIILRGNVETQRDELNKWFRPNDFTFRQLIALDKDNPDKDWYLEGYPVTPPMISDSPTKYTVTLALKQPYWIESDLNTNTWAVTGDTETEVMTNAGNVYALPKIVLTPNHAKGSNAIEFKKYIAIHTSGYGGTFPVDITAAGWDTATLIGSGDMLADGDDAIVYLNNKPTDRWFGGGGINSATTGVWINMTFTPTNGMSLMDALNNSTMPATLQVAIAFSLAYGGFKDVTLPDNGSLLIGSEIITYSTYTVDKAGGIITFTLTKRFTKGSAIASHSAGDLVYWLENEVYLTYGNPTAIAPVQNDNYKPVFDLSTSTNSHWDYLVFGNSGFAQEMAPFQFGKGTYYTDTHGAGTVVPYVVAGLKLESLLSGGGVISDTTAKPSWVFRHPGGVSNITANGEKYRSGTSYGTCTIEAGGTVYYTEATPSTVTTWEAIAMNVNMAANPTQFYFKFTGGLGTTSPPPTAYAELSDAVITIADPPTIAGLTAGANYNFKGYIKNATTGDIINLNNILTKTGDTVTIDCETKEIYLIDGKRIRSSISFSGTKRDEWLTLESGANNIVWVDVGTDDLTIVTTWRGRNTI
jgi:hypothetical protein